MNIYDLINTIKNPYGDIIYWPIADLDHSLLESKRDQDMLKILQKICGLKIKIKNKKRILEPLLDSKQEKIDNFFLLKMK